LAAPDWTDGIRCHWHSLCRGGHLTASFEGDSVAAQALSSGQAQPVSLASEDLNADGVADLVVGYTTSGKGMLAVYLGNKAAFAQGIAAHASSPFSPRAQVFALLEPPDFLVTLLLETDDSQRNYAAV
jgi:hypothetical protein